MKQNHSKVRRFAPDAGETPAFPGSESHRGADPSIRESFPHLRPRNGRLWNSPAIMKPRACILFTAVALLLFALPVSAQDGEMSFFITSAGPGDGANLGGSEGADKHCQALAEAAGSSGKTWRAYLSTDGEDGVDARDRIGSGPWFNAKGVEVARNLDALHYSNVGLTKETQLTEKGEMVKGRGDSPNEHDILTGSKLDGARFTDGADHTCSNWTSNDEGSAQVGHHDRTGGGPVPSSWNSAHGSRGCSQSNLQGTGGNGYYYCFAID